MMQPIWRTSIRADNAAHHGFVGRYLITTHEPLPLGADPTTARAELDGWDLGAGRQVWSRVLESKGDLNVGPWNALDGKIVATVGSGYQVLDPTTGRNAVGQLPVVSSPSAGGDGMPSVIERHEQSGRLLWRTTLPKDCQFGAPGNQYFVGAYVPDVDDSVVAVSGTCDERTAAVSLVDTSRGHVLWTDRLSVSQTPDDSGVRVEQHRDFVLAVTATSVTVYDEAGKSLFTKHAGAMCANSSCAAIQAGDRFVVSTHAGSFAVDRTGRVLWTRQGPLGSVVGAGEYALFMVYEDDDQIPGVLRIVDPADGRSTTASMPVDGRAVDWVGYHDGVVYVISHPPQFKATDNPPGVLTAYRLVPGHGVPELGGGEAVQWPNACQLVAGAELRRLFGADYKAAGRQSTYLAVRFPVPITCDLVPQTRGKPQIRITDAWVAPTAAEASTLFQTFADTPMLLQRMKGLGDAAYAVISEVEPGSGEIYLRRGRFVVRIFSPGNPAAAGRVAALVDHQLRELT